MMRATSLLGIDLGTGSTKAVLLDADGCVAGRGAVTHAVRTTRRGWAESDPEDWWRSIGGAVRAAVGSRARDVGAIGLCGQMHGVVLLDARGRALRAAILWADTRATEELAAYRSLPESEARVLGNPLVPGMAGPILLWLRDNEPDTYAATVWALQPKDWLHQRLTATIATDPSDASATLLYDVYYDTRSEAVIQRLGLRSELFPPVVASVAVVGELGSEAAQALGVDRGIPVVVGAADTAAAMLGSGLLGSRDAQLTVGTGAQLVVDRAQMQPDPQLATHMFRTPSTQGWYAMAAMQNAGLALEWCLRVLGRDWEWAYDHAFAVPPGAEGLTFLPYLSGERTPRMDPHARGAWLGLGLDHGPPAMMRAAFEGVAYAIRDGLDALLRAGHRADALRMIGGGTLDTRWRQLLADVLGRPLVPVDAPDASARGAALLAGLGTGLIPEAAQHPPTMGRAVEPGPNSPAYAQGLTRFRRLGAPAPADGL